VPLYVVHVMSAGAAAVIQQARAAGVRVVGEAVASGFAASEAAVFDPNFEVSNFTKHAVVWVRPTRVRATWEWYPLDGACTTGSSHFLLWTAVVTLQTTWWRILVQRWSAGVKVISSLGISSALLLSPCVKTQTQGR